MYLTCSVHVQLLECATAVHETSPTGNYALHECMPASASMHLRVAEYQRYIRAATHLQLAGCCPWVENAQGGHSDCLCHMVMLQ